MSVLYVLSRPLIVCCIHVDICVVVSHVQRISVGTRVDYALFVGTTSPILYGHTVLSVLQDQYPTVLVQYQSMSFYLSTFYTFYYKIIFLPIS